MARSSSNPNSSDPQGDPTVWASRIGLTEVALLASGHLVLFLVLGFVGLQVVGGHGVIGSIALQAAIQVAMIWAVLVYGRGLSWTEIGFRPMPPGWGIRAPLIGVGMILVVAPINLLVQSLLGAPQANPQVTAIQPTGDTPMMMATTMALTAVVVPAIEEVIFRGVLYRWLRRFSSMGVAIALSALLFGSVHGIIHLIPALAVLGAVLAWTYERTGSLWAPIVIHGIFNAIMMLLLYGVLAAGP